MSVKVTSFYWDSAPQIDGNDKMLMLALADWCNDDGFCYYGMDRICKRMGREPRTIQTIIKSLEERDEILVCPDEGKKTLTGITNRYYLLSYCRANGVVIPEEEIAKAREKRQKQRENGIAGLKARTNGVQKPAPQGVQKPAPQGVQKPAPQGVQKPAPNTFVKPSDDPSDEPLLKTKTNQPAVRSLIMAERLVGLPDDQIERGIDLPEGEDYTTKAVGWFSTSKANSAVDALKEHQHIEPQPPVKATALPPNSGPPPFHAAAVALDSPPSAIADFPAHPPSAVSPTAPPPLVSEYERVLRLLTDPDIEMYQASAEKFADQYNFACIVAHVATWWQQKSDGVIVNGRPLDTNALHKRIRDRWKPGPISDDFLASELYARHYPLTPEQADEWGAWLDAADDVAEMVSRGYNEDFARSQAGYESPPAWLAELPADVRALIDMLPVPLGGGE